MRVDANMSPDNDTKLSVAGWYATTAEYAIGSLRRQLDLAATIWPELAGYRLLDLSQIEDPEKQPLAPG